MHAAEATAREITPAIAGSTLIIAIAVLVMPTFLLCGSVCCLYVIPVLYCKGVDVVIEEGGVVAGVLLGGGVDHEAGKACVQRRDMKRGDSGCRDGAWRGCA